MRNACWSCSNAKCLLNREDYSLSCASLIEEKRELRCKKGQQFIMEGAPVSGLFFILKGKVKVFRTGIGGKEQIVRFAGEGEIVGHRGFGSQEYYPIAAIAIEDTTLCYFSKDLMQEVLKKDPQLTYSLMLFYAEELNKSEAKVKSISQMTVRERIIDTVLYLYRKFGNNRAGFLNIHISRKEYAQYAGTSEEQVIRTLSLLKKEGLLQTKGKQIGITNISLLKREISEHNFFLNS